MRREYQDTFPPPPTSGIPDAFATRSFTYLARGPCSQVESIARSYWSSDLMLADQSGEQLQRFDEHYLRVRNSNGSCFVTLNWGINNTGNINGFVNLT